MKTITLATFNTREQAEPLKHRLEEAHVAAEIHDGAPLKRLWFVSKPVAQAKLDVDAQDYYKARRLMRKLGRRAARRGIVRCPECNSSRVEYPQFTRKFFLPNLIGILSAVGLVKKKYYCEDCHYTWAKDDARHEKHRAHMAPYYFLEDVPEK